ncbi:unnamed protein product [Sympodiomycopsis kandeliae]
MPRNHARRLNEDYDDIHQDEDNSLSALIAESAGVVGFGFDSHAGASADAGPSRSRPPQANQFAQEQDPMDTREDTQGVEYYDDDDAAEFVPSDIESNDEEWRPSEASDEAPSDEDEEYNDHDQISSGRPRHLGAARRGAMPEFHTDSPSSSSSSSALTKQQRKRMALDAMGHEGWRDLAHRQRQRRAGGQGDDSEALEVEEEALDRLMAGLTDTAARQTTDAGEATSSSSSHMPPSSASAKVVHDQFRDEIMKSSGFKKQRKGNKKMRRAVPEQALSHEVRGLIRDANLCYVDQRISEAISIIQEVIRIEPAARSAWACLALCMQELGEKEKELQAKIVEATLTPRATDMWISIAQDSYEKGLSRQAVYCFEQAIRTSTEKDKSDVLDVMWDRACLLRDLGDTVKATEAFNQLLRLRPHSSEILGQIVPLFIARGQTLRAIKALEQSRKFNQTQFTDPTTEDAQQFATYRHSEVVTLADLLLLNREPLAALHVVRQDARWLQGRIRETFWDEVVEDDREFDETREDDARPDAVDYGRRVEMAPVYAPLDVQMRLRLGLARAKIGDLEEAHRHFDIYLGYTEPADYSAQYEELVDLEMDLNENERALDILTRMVQEDFLRVPYLYGKIGACHQALGQSEEAAKCYEPIIEAEPDNLEIKMRLAEIYEDLHRRPEALRLVNEVMQAREEQARARGIELSGAVTSAVDALDDPTKSVRATLKLFDEYQGTGTEGASTSSTARRSRPSGSSQSRKRLTAIDRDQRKRLELAREQETRLMFQRLQAREDVVFFPGWWRTDVQMGSLAQQQQRDKEGGRRVRYGVGYPSGSSQVDIDTHAAAVESWMDAASRLVGSFRSISQLFPRKRLARRGFNTGKKAEDAAKKPADQTWARRRRVDTRESGGGGGGDQIGSQAAELLSRIQDDIANEGARHDEDSGRKGSNNNKGGGGGSGGGTSSGGVEYMLETSFRGVDFEEWVDLFMKYALLQTKLGDYASASEMLQHIRISYAVLHNESHQMAIALCTVSCALYARDYEAAYGALRVLPYTWQFNNTPLRILSSISHTTGFYGLDWFSDANISKMILRRLRIHEAIAVGLPYEFSQQQNRYVVKEKLRASRQVMSSRKRPGQSQSQSKGQGGETSLLLTSGNQGDSEDEEDEDFNSDSEDEMGNPRQPRSETPASSAASKIRNEGTPSIRSNSPHVSGNDGSGSSATRVQREQPPKKPTPLAELYYSYYLLAAGSYQAALAYSLRAYSRLPHDPLICLTVGIACLGRMTNRQTDNRHHLLIQGLSFLNRYRQLRCSSTNNRKTTSWMEATYNFARALHSLGLLSMAVPKYESVLAAYDAHASSSDKAMVGFDCHREAAWNLSLICSINGDVRYAKRLMTKYLAIPTVVAE